MKRLTLISLTLTAAAAALTPAAAYTPDPTTLQTYTLSRMQIVTLPKMGGGRIYFRTTGDGSDAPNAVYSIGTNSGENAQASQTEVGIELGPYVPAHPEGLARFYYVGENNALYCFAAGNAGEEWKYPFDGIVTLLPVENGAFIYQSTEMGEIVCLNASNGSVVWKAATGSSFKQRPFVEDGRLYAGDLDGVFFCFDALTGTGIWTNSTGGTVVYDIAGSAPGLLIRIGQAVSLIDKQTGATLWIRNVGQFITGSPVADGGRVFFRTDDHLYCSGLSNGELAWSVPINAPLANTPLGTNGILYTVGTDRVLTAYNETNGDVLWSYTRSVNLNRPVYDEGVLYFGTSAGLTGLNATNGHTEFELTNAGVFEDGLDPDGSAIVITDGHFYFSDSQNIYSLSRFIPAEATNVPGPKIYAEIWKYPSTGPVYSSPCVDNGRVYFGNRSDRLVCLEATNGRKAWAALTSGDVDSSPCADGERVYCGSEQQGIFRCFSTRSGRPIWTYLGESPVHSSPLLHEGCVYYGDESGTFYCLNAANGSLVWKFHAEGPVYSSPEYADDRLYFGSYDGRLYCINADSGMGIWAFQTDARIFSSPVADNGRVYFGDENKQIYCLNAESGEKIWGIEVPAPVHTSPAVWENKLYFGSYDGYMRCLDGTTGEALWQFQAKGLIEASPCVAGGKVLFGDETGTFYILDAETGAVEWSFDAGAPIYSSAAVTGGRVYFGTMKGDLYCIDLLDPGIHGGNSVSSQTYGQ